MTYKECDILISGGGIAGLTAAAAFGTAGFDVICVDPTSPVTTQDDNQADMRSTAMLQPARTFLESCQLWEKLAPHAAALQVMRIVDAGGQEATPRVVKDFNASEVSELPFGWNFPNWLLRREIIARLKELPNVAFMPGTATTSLFTREGEARVGLSTGERLRTKLVVAADGRHSSMRTAAGIRVKTSRYGQKALAFAATHDTPHENISTEIHRSGGPFTLVPLPDRDGRPCSAIVWMDDGKLTQQRMEMDGAQFETVMTERSCHLFGPLRLASHRTIWPIISQKAARLSGERIALIAEAAHVVPPIGAQGLNMSLTDTATLLGLTVARPDALGDRAMMDAYHTSRHRDVALRVQGIDLLNRASQASAPALRDVRAVGLNALYALAPVRHMLMQMGLGIK